MYYPQLTVIRGLTLGATSDPKDNLVGIVIVNADDFDDDDGEALWSTLNFTTSARYQPLVEEYYDADLSRIGRVFHQGVPFGETGASPFRKARLDEDGIRTIHLGFTRMIRAGFNIQRVLLHLHADIGEAMELEVLHLGIAIHALESQWRKYLDTSGVDVRKNERTISDGDHSRISSALKQRLDSEIASSTTIAEDAGRTYARAVARALSNANSASMRDRLLRFFSSTGMTLNKDDLRALGARNPLAHDGGFPAELDALEYDKKNIRLRDMYRLRNLATEAILRLVGYTGEVDDYENPGQTRTISGSAGMFAS